MELLIVIAQISHYKENVTIACGKIKNAWILQTFALEIYVALSNTSQIAINLLVDVISVFRLIIVDIIQTYLHAKIQLNNAVGKIVVLIKELIQLEIQFVDVLQI
jgi:hypothetical protein